MGDERPDPDLLEAVEEIPDADPDSVQQYEDMHGHFVINSEEEAQDVDVIDNHLSEAGYERDGVLAVPDMVQQNFAPADNGGEDGD